MNFKKLLGTLICATVLLQSCSTSDPNIKSTKQTKASSAKFKTYSAEEFFQTTTIFGSSINHDATAVLMTSDETGIFNVYRQNIDGSARTPLTHSTKESTFAVSWFPQDDRILFSADEGGNELDHLFVRETNGESQDLTPGDNLKAMFVRWHQNNHSFYVATNERDPKFFDLYQYQVADYSRKMVFENNQGYSLDAVSPDGNYLVANKSISNSDNNLYLVKLSQTNSQPELITEHQGSVSYSAFSFTPDSKNLIYGTNEHGEFSQAWQYNITNKQHTVNYVADWDVRFSYFSKQGTYQVIGVNQDAQTKLHIRNVSNNKPLSLPAMPAGDLRGVNFSEDEKTLVFYLNSDTSPSNLYVHQLGAKNITRLSNSGNPSIIEENLVTGEVRRFKSFDGLEIPGILFKPKQAENKKVPALVFIHGGPGGQSRKGYRPMIQHLVNNGYAIFMINNRGSSGYGKTFYHLDDKKHGDHDLKDVVYNKYYLQKIDWIDKDRIGVIGGSYGGYLTMAAMAFTDEFKVGVNIFGVTNWVRTLESIPPYWEAFRKELYDELGDPATDKERLHNISPVFFGHQVKKPVLVVQGANDPRVLKIESDEMVESIRSAGTYVDYLVFDDEGHGFTKKVNRISASQRYLSFLKDHL
ncbi:MAG: S9 family peptidase [Pseudoalteromonas spongiae]